MLTMSCLSPSAILHSNVFLSFVLNLVTNLLQIIYSCFLLFFDVQIIFFSVQLIRNVVILASYDLSLKLVCSDSLLPYNKIR